VPTEGSDVVREGWTVEGMVFMDARGEERRAYLLM